MGEKYVVFVDETLVAGSVQMAAANAGYNVARGISDGPMSVADELDLRRSVLDSLAATLIGDVAADAGSAASAMSTFSLGVVEGDAFPAASLAPVRGLDILEGISAIVIDDEFVDVKSLEGVFGLTVVPNIEVPLPEIVVSEMQAPAEDWHLRQIGIQTGTEGGKGILIGILDTGIDANHPEFAGKNIHFQEFDRIGRKLTNAARDAGDHGTHVSSIAAGNRAGVAPDADLAVAAVLTIRDQLGRMSGTLVQIVNGFNWLVTTKFREDDPGVDVINASLGGAGFNTYLQQSVRTAFQLGVPLIAAIGNAGRAGAGHHGSPGNYPEVLSVGATDSSDVVADFSDWGISPPPTGPNYSVPELCAPGVDVFAAVPGGNYEPKSGTSMATPVVTGVAARRMSDNNALIGQPAALFTNLQSGLAPYHINNLGNQGGAGRIVA